MAAIQGGVSERSEMYFSSLHQGRGLFFYPLSVGHFYCNSDYRVERDFFDSILVTYIIRGAFSFFADGRKQTARSGEAALIDCFHPHVYFADPGFEAYWVHIEGPDSYEIYRELKARRGSIIAAGEQTETRIKEIFYDVKFGGAAPGTDRGGREGIREFEKREGLRDSAMSLKLYGLLMELFDYDDADNRDEAVSQAVNYILSHYGDGLSVAEVADSVHLSPSQFSRRFKRKTGASPYDYILGVRLTKAKELLKNTRLSVSEIAYRTGFGSDANFIYFFKKQEGISPLKFRNLLF